MNKMQKLWHFDIDNDRQTDLVLKGFKTAITLLEKPKNFIVDEDIILTFDNEKKACVINIVDILEIEFGKIDEKMSALERLGTYEDWKKTYFTRFKEKSREFDEHSKVFFVRFKFIENLLESRLKIADKIAKGNLDIFEKINSIEEINAGFNNSIFSVNDKYIIKVCEDPTKEKTFDTEYNFYKTNSDSENIPVLYKYDKSKKIVPYTYEIIEKVKGETLYYHWYKMSENERERLIEKIIKALRAIHSKESRDYDWKSWVKEKILSNFNKCSDMFDDEETDIILSTVKKCDEIFAENKFCLIHNDLHFDNILLDEKSDIKFIDFNDSMVAPFDFDLRLLYFSVDVPWKWANTEMDPLQKPEDYKHLFEYVKKYYDELNEVKFLEERMLVYWVLNDINLLPRFRDIEEKDRIIMNCKKVLKI